MGTQTDEPLYARVMRRPRTCSALETLLAMGFPRSRALKALVSTAEKGVEEACEWLFSHLSDPSLDAPLPREFVLYLCPSGPLEENLMDFWRSCPSNPALAIPPHITLCQFFPCPDEAVSPLLSSLGTLAERLQPSFPQALSLRLVTAAAFLGLFVRDDQADVLRSLAGEFTTTATGIADVQVEPHRKQLHLTLAYQLQSTERAQAERLARCLDPSLPAAWHLRLYSRDLRYAGQETQRVLYSYYPQNDDELELIPGDFIFISPGNSTEALSGACTQMCCAWDLNLGSGASQQPKPSVWMGTQDRPTLCPISCSEGWLAGVSHLSGLSGFFPENYTERAHEAATWLLHRSYPMCEEIEGREMVKRKGDMAVAPPIPPHSFNGQTGDLQLHLTVIRHGERVDVTFGRHWLARNLDSNGTYIPKDLNLPPFLPVRPAGHRAQQLDPPLTRVGQLQAQLTGEAMRDKRVPVDAVFCSPALRCVQTAHYIIKGLGLVGLTPCVEPGLFEWMHWLRGVGSGGTSSASGPGEAGGSGGAEGSSGVLLSHPWMGAADLAAAGLPVDESYRPLISPPSLSPCESYEDFIKRIDCTARELMALCRAQGFHSVLFIGHAASLEACTRPLRRLPPRPQREFVINVRKVPYLGLCSIRELSSGSSRSWALVSPPIPPLSHGPNPTFSWSQVLCDP
uniref:Ubiquitin associated and SH3 domain containing B n=1 Tax=Eptatretus burgeri TaxID=7764 RepID=A0A8C4Q8G8_EPTBU